MGRREDAALPRHERPSRYRRGDIENHEAALDFRERIKGTSTLQVFKGVSVGVYREGSNPVQGMKDGGKRPVFIVL